MQQFKPYPIYINHSMPTSDNVEELVRDMEGERWFESSPNARLNNQTHRAEQYQVDQKKAYHLLETKEIAHQFPEQTAWENSVVEQLKIISKTAVGKLLLDWLNPQEKFWIIPLTGAMRKRCQCSAFVLSNSFSSDYGKGIRLYMPTFVDAKVDSFPADDALFHELIHAYRTGWLNSDQQRNQVLREYQKEEEFLAVYMTNIYRACRGYLDFNRSHSDSTLLAKDKIYNYLSSDIEAINALGYFRYHDRLAANVAKWAYPFFNPWRDYPVLYREFLQNSFVYLKSMLPIPF